MKNWKEILKTFVAFTLGGFISFNLLCPTLSVFSIEIDIPGFLKELRDENDNTVSSEETTSSNTVEPQTTSLPKKRKQKKKKSNSEQSNNSLSISSPSYDELEKLFTDLSSEKSEPTEAPTLEADLDVQTKKVDEGKESTELVKTNIEFEENGSLIVLGEEPENDNVQLDITKLGDSDDSTETYSYTDVCNSPGDNGNITYIPVHTGEYCISLSNYSSIINNTIYFVADLEGLLEYFNKTNTEEPTPSPSIEPTPTPVLDSISAVPIGLNEPRLISLGTEDTSELFSYTSDYTFIPNFNMDCDSESTIHIDVYRLDNLADSFSTSIIEFSTGGSVSYLDHSFRFVEGDTYIIKVSLISETDSPLIFDFMMNEYNDL